jgi:hypothetical protein
MAERPNWFATTRLWSLAPALGAWLLGMVFAHRPMFLSGFELNHGDAGDTRFVNYILEHGWRWFIRSPNHLSLWDMPMLYPAKNVAAYSEVMLGMGPFYWVWRALGAGEELAFQLWTLTCSTLNFVSAYLVLRRVFYFRGTWSAVGAFIFAFALARTNQLNHQQLTPHFWAMFTVYFAGRALVPVAGVPRWKRRRDILAFFACLSLLLWGGFYVGWFFGLGLGIAGLWTLFFDETRDGLLGLLKSEPWTLALGAGLAALTLWPMATHYLTGMNEVGGRKFHELTVMIPRPLSWFHTGNHSAMYGWMMSRFPEFAFLPVEGEHRIGMGLVTTVAWMAGLALAWRRPSMRVLLLSGLTLMLLATIWPNGFTFWRSVYEWVPGGKAIRAVVRIGMLLLIPASVGVAALLEYLSARGRALTALALGLWMMLEQGFNAPMYAKTPLRQNIERLAGRIDPSCESFLYTPIASGQAPYVYMIDAMFAGLIVGKPTVNGYSGNAPPQWDLGNIDLWSLQDEERVKRALDHWRTVNHLAESQVCWLQTNHALPLSARMVAQEVPRGVAPGQTFRARLTVQNNGELAWSPQTGDALGVELPRDAPIWGATRLRLPRSVEPKTTVTLEADLTAPEQPGKYPFRWRMVREQVAWYGQPTPLVWIDVGLGPVTSP